MSQKMRKMIVFLLFLASFSFLSAHPIKAVSAMGFNLSSNTNIVELSLLAIIQTEEDMVPGIVTFNENSDEIYVGYSYQSPEQFGAGQLRVWDFINNENMISWDWPHPLNIASFSPSDKNIISRNMLINTLTGQVIASRFPHTISSDGRVGIVLEMPGEDVDYEQFVDLETHERTSIQFPNYSRRIYKISPDNTFVAVGYRTGNIVIVNLINMTSIEIDAHESSLTDIEFHPNNNELLVSSGSNGSVKLWNATNGDLVKLLIDEGIYKENIDFSNSGDLLLIGDDFGNLYIWNTDNFAEFQIIDLTQLFDSNPFPTIQYIEFSDNDQYIAVTMNSQVSILIVTQDRRQSQ